ncbi:MAG: LysM peptidoglycan-binding domain-containing protein [Planctomycetes bacterium]|nr:LysM peptidoglycan-binding domain-containing protein [Planctomycetota bacterium]
MIGTGGTGPSAAHRTYVVQKGDAGFWAVAEKVYGDGRLWQLIAKANPGVDSNALRPGKKLIIPPKPVARPEPAGGGASPRGGLVVGPNGRRTYIVQKGDAGFWAVAEKVYGDGKYWTLIAKANPTVKSSALQPGDRLIVPAGPALSGATAGSGAAVSGGAAAGSAATGGVSPGPGQKVYIVRKGDNGFWTVAKKVYGNGTYWPLISKANPGVHSDSLKAGQKLIIPPLTDEIRSSMSGPRTPTRPASAGSAHARPSDVEDIGPQPLFR